MGLIDTLFGLDAGDGGDDGEVPDRTLRERGLSVPEATSGIESWYGFDVGFLRESPMTPAAG